MKPVISVIVPVYNVEPYLCRCIDSIRGQTLQEIEIILVNDGSTDNCGRICDAYALQDLRIRVIHQENRGLSAARNIGIENARADIVGFVDSDDWIEPDMFAFLYQNLLKENADISVCGMIIHRNEKIEMKGDLSYAVQSGTDAIQSIFQRPGAGMAAWNKLFRKHLFDCICFPEGRIYEDIFVMIRLADTANKVVFDMQPKYHYIRRTGSITMRPYSIHLHDHIDAAFENYNYVRNKYPDLEDLVWYAWVNAYFTVLITMFVSNGENNREKEKELIGFLKANRNLIWPHPAFTKKRKWFLLALCIHSSLCKGLIRLLKIRPVK